MLNYTGPSSLEKAYKVHSGQIRKHNLMVNRTLFDIDCYYI